VEDCRLAINLTYLEEYRIMEEYSNDTLLRGYINIERGRLWQK
jgi:hypothetical protein